IVWVGLHPEMVGSGMVRHKIEQQLDATTRQPFSELRQRPLAAQRVTDGVCGDRKTGAGDILLGQVGQNRLKFGAPLRVAARNRPPGSADLPDAKQPDPVETLLCKAIERRVVDIREGDPLASLMRQTLKPDTRVDLI